MLFRHGEFPPARAFQLASHEATRQAAREAHKRILIMASTGAGKTWLGLKIIAEALKKIKTAMFICDRKTLIAQTSEAADSYGLGDHGIIQAQNPRLDLSKPFQIASVQTLMSRGFPDKYPDVIVIDEAHTMSKKLIAWIAAPECTAIVIGLSATPFTPGLGKTFTKLVNATTMHELTELGILVPMRIFSCRKPDMEGAATSGREWTEKAAEERELVIVGDVILEWQRLAYGLKTIVFGSTIKHCEELALQFNEAGISAALFTANTNDEERKMILRDFTDGSVKVLVSVEALAKGFDVKDIGCVCDCRPLRKSLSTAIQMWGRGLRSSTETGKKECILLDFSGNIIRFADDFSKIFYEGLAHLDDGERLDKEIRKDEGKEPKACPKCGYSPMGGKKCVGCGFEIPAKSSLVEHMPGEMAEVVLNGKKLAPDQIHLYAQLATYAKEHSAPEKQNGRAAHLFKDITGTWPPRNLTVETAPEVPPTRNTLNKIRSLHIAFQHRRTA